MALMDWIFGRPLATAEEDRQRVGTVAGVPMLGLDALASAAYGPEAALTMLIVSSGVLGALATARRKRKAAGVQPASPGVVNNALGELGLQGTRVHC